MDQYLKDSFTSWPGKVTSRDLFGIFLFFLGVHLVVAPATMALLHISLEEGAAQGWLVIYSMYLACFSLFFYTAKLSDTETRISLSPFGAGGSWSAFRIGALSFLIAYPLVVAIGKCIRIVQLKLFDSREVDQVAVQTLKLSFDYPAMSVFMAIGVICVVPIAEELLFRGYLQGWLRRFIHPKSAIFFASAVFALFHFSLAQGWSNIEYLVSLFTLSLILGFLYEKQRSLWAPIGLHAVFNCVNVILLVVSQLEM
ncbi:putative membrane protein [Waddlia chondrophila 2032/99]|uniref:Putative membrane protein n=1 Tax=Waddlia chondrophila 2032/99 TaxID=765953 RepID=F8LDB2_9BACT|nr:putative membrane protein [Waddlia chondrophila 2032/99]